MLDILMRYYFHYLNSLAHFKGVGMSWISYKTPSLPVTLHYSVLAGP